MEIRPVRRDEAVGLRELRLRALRDAPYAYFASLEREERLPLSYWEDWATKRGQGHVRGSGSRPMARHRGRVLTSKSERHGEPVVAVGGPKRAWPGLARRLVEARADWARELGAVRLELAVAENNEAAKALYRGLGFVPTGERRSMASDPTRAGIFMARPL
jgi:GNAT superfamily N-acetyltransferase